MTANCWLENQDSSTAVIHFAALLENLHWPLEAACACDVISGCRYDTYFALEKTGRETASLIQPVN